MTDSLLVWELAKQSDGGRRWFTECGRFAVDDYRRGVKRRYRLSVRTQSGNMAFVAGYCSSTAAKNAAVRRVKNERGG